MGLKPFFLWQANVYEKQFAHRYQLVGIVAHSGELQQNKGHYISFLNISGLMTIQSSLHPNRVD
jgi:ubiquitin C-terminal hydrolase